MTGERDKGCVRATRKTDSRKTDARKKDCARASKQAIERERVSGVGGKG